MSTTKKTNRKSNANAKNALKEINKIAKQIRAENPQVKWTDAIKQAGAKYRKDRGLPEKVPRTKKSKKEKKVQKAMEKAEDSAFNKDLKQAKATSEVSMEFGVNIDLLDEDEIMEFKKAMDSIKKFENKIKKGPAKSRMSKSKKKK